jgi:hypothetical protein
MMHFGAPQIILTAMMLLGMGIAMARYGEQKRDKYDISDVVIAPAVVFGILWWGGFYG